MGGGGEGGKGRKEEWSGGEERTRGHTGWGGRGWQIVWSGVSPSVCVCVGRMMREEIYGVVGSYICLHTTLFMYILMHLYGACIIWQKAHAGERARRSTPGCGGWSLQPSICSSPVPTCIIHRRRTNLAALTWSSAAVLLLGCDGTADPLISFNSKCSRLPCILIRLPALFLLVITCLVY